MSRRTSWREVSHRSMSDHRRWLSGLRSCGSGGVIPRRAEFLITDARTDRPRGILGAGGRSRGRIISLRASRKSATSPRARTRYAISSGTVGRARCRPADRPSRSARRSASASRARMRAWTCEGLVLAFSRISSIGSADAGEDPPATRNDAASPMKSGRRPVLTRDPGRCFRTRPSAPSPRPALHPTRRS